MNKLSAEESGAVASFGTNGNLRAAAAELLRIYDRLGGPACSVAVAVEAQIWRVAGVSLQTRGKAVEPWLRTLDLHRWVTEESGLVPLKLRVLESVLLHCEPRTRWMSAREILQAHLEISRDRQIPHFERYKQELTLRGGAVGSILQLIALVNVESGAETPPQNVSLRFVPGRFPDHVWEESRNATRREDLWFPRNPLCRWEYLAADLLHALMSTSARRAQERSNDYEFPYQWTSFSEQASIPGAAPGGNVYCRIEDQSVDASGAAQMPLLPAQAHTLLPEILRMIHRRVGAEGLRQAALLLAHLTGATPGKRWCMHWDDVSTIPGETGLAPRARKLRAIKMARVLELLEKVAVHRVENGSQPESVNSSRMLTCLGRASAVEGSAPRPAPALCAEVLVDALFFPAFAPSMGHSFRRLPRTVLAENPREHPFIIALAALLIRQWEQQEVASILCTAGALLCDAGLWIPSGSRYRALEQMKRDLTKLQELGMLRSWRIARSAVRDAWQDQLRLVAPGTSGP